MPSIRRAKRESDLDAARPLFRTYAESLDYALDFQDSEAEMEAPPGPYAPPMAPILLAEGGRDGGGCGRATAQR